MHQIYKFEDDEEKRNFKELITIYRDKLEEREKELQHFHIKQKSLLEKLNEQQEKHSNLEDKMTSLDQEYHSLKNDQSQLTIKEKALQKLIEERKASLEFELQK